MCHDMVHILQTCCWGSRLISKSLGLLSFAVKDEINIFLETQVVLKMFPYPNIVCLKTVLNSL